MGHQNVRTPEGANFLVSGDARMINVILPDDQQRVEIISLFNTSFFLAAQGMTILHLDAAFSF